MTSEEAHAKIAKSSGFKAALARNRLKQEKLQVLALTSKETIMKPDVPYSALVELSGTSFPVYVSEGTERQARQIAERCQRAHAYLSDTFDYSPPMRVLVLAPEHWPEYAASENSRTYGMPHFTDAQTIVVAGEDNDFWQSMTPPVDALPPQAAAIMRSAYGLPSGSINLSRFFDLLAVHEMGHLFHTQASVHFPRRWLMELFCNMCTHTYIATIEPGLLPALEAFPSVVVGGGMSHLRYHTLEDFERLYGDVGPQNYGWYQCRLHVAAKDIFNAGGVHALQHLWAAFRQSNTTLSNDELRMLLEDEVDPAVARVLTEWPV